MENLKENKIWNYLITEFNLDNKTQEKIIFYINYLILENQKYDLTAIKNIDDIFNYHLIDTLMANKLNLLKDYKFIADIGSGAGIPGLILAITNPDKNFYFIEVLNKRIKFLEEVIEKLNLKNCIVYKNDFKTFVRKFNNKIDLFTARASLNLTDISFIYNGISLFKDSYILYWGSEIWKKDPENIIKKYNVKIDEIPYNLENRKRYYVLVKLIK